MLIFLDVDSQRDFEIHPFSMKPPLKARKHTLATLNQRGNSMPNQCESLIKDLALTAAEQTKLSGMSELLRKIAEYFSASGCMLWQLDEVMPDEQEEENGQDGPNEQETYLFVQGVWFRNDKQIYQLEPLSEHIAQALNDQKNQVQVINKISIAANFEATVCVAPAIPAKHATCGINLFRDTEHQFTEAEALKISEAVEVIPTLLQTIRNRVGFQLLLEVNQLLHEAETEFSISLAVPKAQVILNRICKLISGTFQCLETTIALEDPFESPGIYKCLATTWPEMLQKSQYDETVDPGITGWVLKHNKSVRIIDLDKFDIDLELIQQKYPGISWNQKTAVVSVVSKLSGGLTEEELPPLTFMAVPIVKGDKVLGVVRCSVARITSKEEPTGGPFFFTEYELNLLKLVANPIGQFWMNQLRLRESAKEAQSWKKVIDQLRELNQFVLSGIQGKPVDEKQMYQQALLMVSTQIKGFIASDVRLLDPKTHELYFAETYGSAWDEGTPEQKQGRLQRRFPSHLHRFAVGVEVFQSGDTCMVADAQKDQRFDLTFPETKGFLIVPIKGSQKTVGVLDFRSRKAGEFSPFAVAIATLFGQQLGLYHELRTTTQQLRESEEKLKANVEQLRTVQDEQNRAYLDLAHQLKGPINQTLIRTQLLLELLDRTDTKASVTSIECKDLMDRISKMLAMARGLCRKAKRVTSSIGLFADLAKAKRVSLDTKRLITDEVIKMLIETAQDNEQMLIPRKTVRFQVYRMSIEVLDSFRVEVNWDLLEQAVNNLLDNAGKYSFNYTDVTISGGIIQKEWFYISVANVGLPIEEQEIELAVQRRWRGKSAQQATGEGSGIGLWVVDNIMKAHQGKLIILPTTSDHRTEVRLLFPLSNRL